MRGHIVKYTDKELAAMEARGEDRTDWNAVRAKTEQQLATDIAGDPAWDGVPQDWVSRAQAASRIMGRPKENKRQVPWFRSPCDLTPTCSNFSRAPDAVGRGA
jgi:hypothetical protein